MCEPDALPPALLDISVRRVGDAYYVCPADWEQLRHEEGGAGRPVPYWARPWPSGFALAAQLKEHPPRGRDHGARARLRARAAQRRRGAAGANVLATDGSTDAVAFAAHVLALNEVEGEVAHVDWCEHGSSSSSAGRSISSSPPTSSTRAPTSKRRCASFHGSSRRPERCCLADPNRAGAQRFPERRARSFFELVTERGQDVSLHTLRLADPRVGGHT